MSAPNPKPTAEKRAPSAARQINGHHHNISRESPSVLKLTKSSDRAPNIGAFRLAVEAYLRALKPDATAGTTQIARDLHCSTKKASNTLQSMANDGFAVNISTHRSRGLWRMKNNTAQPSQKTTRGHTPVCNSMQPNGSIEYWQKHQAWVMTPARVELGGREGGAA